jgi:hypothetical protein
MKQLDKIGIIIKAAIFCAIIAAFVSSIVLNCEGILKGAFSPISAAIFFLYAFIPASACGSLFGALGSIYLILRTKQIGSGMRMFAEAGALGVVFSLFGPALISLIGLGDWPTLRDWSTPLGFRFCLAVGVPVSILYAAYFRSSMLSTASSSIPAGAKEDHTTLP